MSHNAEKGRAQGGFKSETGRAAYWRMQHEHAIHALSDLLTEHRELVEAVEALAADWHCDDPGCDREGGDFIRKATGVTPPAEGES